jgi:hypothetical protein
VNQIEMFCFAARVNEKRRAYMVSRRHLIKLRVEAKRLRELEAMQRAARFAC